MSPPLELHRSLRGKIGLQVKAPIKTKEDLALVYTPGVAEPCREIQKDAEKSYEYTGKGNAIAIVTDGSAVLGLGDIGPEAALPVMEGKAALFKELADIDAYPLCLDTKDTDEIVQIVKAVAPTFGGINLEDISAPRCFDIEERLKKELSIPVFHDDQHGTAIVVLAGLLNALRVTGKDVSQIKVVISGAGAAGVAITRILLTQGISNILIADSSGIISRNRSDLNSIKTFLAGTTNPENVDGDLAEAMKESDVFIGVSAPGLVSPEMVQSMKEDAILFAMANPDPEILPDAALKAGAKVVATGRSDFPNQVNNLLAFPGVFRGALDARASDITEKMNLAAAKALSECVPEPSAENILPDPLDKSVAKKVADAVKEAV